MKASKILGGLISVVSIVGMVAFALGLQSMFSVIQTGMPAGGEISLDPSSPTVFMLTPSNTGFLDATLDVSIELKLDGSTIASDDFSIVVPAGTQTETQLELSITDMDLPVITEDSVMEIVTEVKIKSLFDYISFDFNTVATGGSA